MPVSENRAVTTHQKLHKRRHRVIHLLIQHIVLRLFPFGRRSHRRDDMRRRTDPVIRSLHNRLFRFIERHAGKRRRIHKMRTVRRLIVPAQPRLLEEMRLEPFIGTTDARLALIRHIIARVHKTVFVAVAPHHTSIHRTLRVDTSVPVAVIIGNDTMLQRAVEIRHTAGIRPHMPGSGAVMNEAVLQHRA